jgi:hypothetical protein
MGKLMRTDIAKHFKHHRHQEELRLLREEIAHQNKVAISDKHSRWCACWRCIGRLQAWVIETRRGDEGV